MTSKFVKNYFLKVIMDVQNTPPAHRQKNHPHTAKLLKFMQDWSGGIFFESILFYQLHPDRKRSNPNPYKIKMKQERNYTFSNLSWNRISMLLSKINFMNRLFRKICWIRTRFWHENRKTHNYHFIFKSKQKGWAILYPSHILQKQGNQWRKTPTRNLWQY